MDKDAMVVKLNTFQHSRGATIVSVFLSILLTAPGFSVGFMGITDELPSSPRGVAGFAEMAGFLFCAWSFYIAARLLTQKFLENMLARIGYLVASCVLAYGFYLLMSVLGLEASFEH